MANKSDTKNEVDMNSSPSIYTTDLLESNIDCECQSKFNPTRRNTPCCAEWSMTIDDVSMLWKEICKNRKPLGYRWI